jgi:aminoglycoside N3'-acetyltransferase
VRNGQSAENRGECPAAVSQPDIEAALKRIGIIRGDVVLAHSSLKSYETWHMDKPSDVGCLTEYFRKLPGVFRSDHATHSVAAKGACARALTCEHGAYGPRYGVFGDYAFSRSSPWQKMYDRGGKVVFIGVTMSRNTFKHFIEYRIVDEALARIADPGARERLKEMVWDFGHYENRGERIWPTHDGEQMQTALDRMGLIRKTACGNAGLLCVGIREMVDEGMRMLAREPERWYTPDVVGWLKAVESLARLRSRDFHSMT